MGAGEGNDLALVGHLDREVLPGDKRRERWLEVNAIGTNMRTPSNHSK